MLEVWKWREDGYEEMDGTFIKYIIRSSHDGRGQEIWERYDGGIEISETGYGPLGQNWELVLSC